VRRFAVLAVLLNFVAMTWTIAQAQEPTSLERLLIQYRCPVVDRLERIYSAGDPVKHRDEYLIIDLPPHPERYVQCIFYAPKK
jgi:hypothetical protein